MYSNLFTITAKTRIQIYFTPTLRFAWDRDLGVTDATINDLKKEKKKKKTLFYFILLYLSLRHRRMYMIVQV